MIKGDAQSKKKSNLESVCEASCASRRIKSHSPCLTGERLVDKKQELALEPYTVPHKSEYSPHISVKILFYLFMGQHWRNDNLLQW